MFISRWILEVPSPSTEEDTSTVYIKEEYVEMANTEMTGNDKMKLLLSYLFTRRGPQSYKIMKCIF